MIDSHCHLDHEPLISNLEEVIDRSRPDHLWEKVGNDWKLRKPIWESN